jgi:hypothetical protein
LDEYVNGSASRTSLGPKGCLQKRPNLKLEVERAAAGTRGKQI